MTYSKFVNELKSDIKRTACKKDFEMTARMIFFVSNQYPKILDNSRTYGRTLKIVKTYLRDNFGWSMTEIHKCFCILHNLKK